MSEDCLYIQSSTTKTKAITKKVLESLNDYVWFNEEKPKIEVEQNKTLSLKLENVCLDSSELNKLFVHLKKQGLTDMTANQWYDNVGEQRFFRYESDETYEFESLDEFNAWNKESKFVDENEVKVLKAVKDNPCYMLIKFDRAEKPDAKVISKIRQSAKVVFEECHISSSKTSYHEGKMHILYAGYIFQDYVFEMVDENYCVDKIFQAVIKAKGTNLEINIHHKELPVECISFTNKKLRLVTRFMLDGLYTKRVISKSLVSKISMDDYEDDEASQMFGKMACKVHDGLKLSHTAESAPIEKYMKRIDAAAKKYNFQNDEITLKKLSNVNFQPLIVINEGYTSTSYLYKAGAVGLILRCVFARKNQGFNSGDYSIFDAVENCYYILQDDLSWITIHAEIK